MKFFTGLSSLVAAIALAGCSANTPAYSAKERFAQMHRNNTFEAEAINDDIDNIMLFRPSNQGSIWNVYHRD
jgi:lipoprotein NlpI